MPRVPDRAPDPADAALFQAAVEASGLSTRAFGLHVLRLRDERMARAWWHGQRPLTGPVRQLARAVVRDPSLAAYLADAPPGA